MQWFSGKKEEANSSNTPSLTKRQVGYFEQEEGGEENKKLVKRQAGYFHSEEDQVWLLNRSKRQAGYFDHEDQEQKVQMLRDWTFWVKFGIKELEIHGLISCFLSWVFQYSNHQWSYSRDKCFKISELNVIDLLIWFNNFLT